MTKMIVGIALLFLVGGTGSNAEAAPSWCVFYDGSTYNCSFYSWEQCYETAFAKIKEMRVYSTRATMREAFAAEMSPIVGLTIKVYDDPAKACASADIILAATNAIVPVMKPEWIEKGMHISTIKPEEFSPAVVAKADVRATLIEDCDPVFIPAMACTCRRNRVGNCKTSPKRSAGRSS